MKRKIVQLMGVGVVFLLFCLMEVSSYATELQNNKQKVFINSLEMRFVPVPQTKVLFSVWETRVVDYEVFIQETRREWQPPLFQQEKDHPVVGVSWEDARAFCVWLTQREQTAGSLPAGAQYRLPTDLEWSLAVGLDSESPAAVLDMPEIYPWGEEWPPPVGSGNYHRSLLVDHFEKTSPVGSFKPNAFGLYDLGGNVWEWCHDRYGKSADFRVLRGASWRLRSPADLMSTNRVGNRPDIRLPGYGFRLVVEPAPLDVPTP